ncbi:MAG: FAD:protein FMN transferase [Pseudomonadota bacterium]
MFKLGIALLILVLLFDVSEAATPVARDCHETEKAGEGSWYIGDAAIMGTPIHVELWSETAPRACALIEEVMAEMRRIDALMSPYIETSMLSRLNSLGSSEQVEVGEELYNLIEQSIAFSRLTNGAFDVTYASAGRYYDFRKGERPSDETLRQALAAINYRYLLMNERRHAIRFGHEGVYVDLGGIAKGYAVDRGIRILQQHGVADAMVSAGGDSRIIGDRKGQPWVVGIRHPRAEDANLAVLPLMDVSVSTSGDYERYFERDGVRYHHIIDPTTGDSARDLVSVTILGADATTTDALSTSVFVLGREAGLALIDQLEGIDAIVVDGSGVMHLSASISQMNQNNTVAQVGAK